MTSKITTGLKVFAPSLLLLQLGGCFIMTNSDVVSVGKDTFTVSSTGRGGYSTGQTTLNATQTASRYCEGLGKKMMMRNSESSGVTGFSPVVSNIIFNCLYENDPAYGSVQMTTEPTSKILIERK